jgi:hypothetical protein
MIHSSRLCLALAALLFCLALGCGNGGGSSPAAKKNKTTGPWCAAHQRIKIIDHIIGHDQVGNKYKELFVDDEGQEHDPEKLADQAWGYLEATGDARKIKQAFSDGQSPDLVIVAIKPLIVILGTHQDANASKKVGDSPGRWYWLGQVATRGDPAYQKDLQWFSPDLKQKPTKLVFSLGGVAEIPLGNGTLKLTHTGEKCKTERE